MPPSPGLDLFFLSIGLHTILLHCSFIIKRDTEFFKFLLHLFIKGWGHSPVLEYLASVGEAHSSTPTPQNQNKAVTYVCVEGLREHHTSPDTIFHLADVI